MQVEEFAFIVRERRCDSCFHNRRDERIPRRAHPSSHVALRQIVSAHRLDVRGLASGGSSSCLRPRPGSESS
jgi:hypothetical protein